MDGMDGWNGWMDGGKIPRVWVGRIMTSRASEELERLRCDVLDEDCWPDLIVRLHSSSLDNCEFWKVG